MEKAYFLVGNLQDVEDLLGNMDLTSSPVVLAAKLQVKGDQKIIGVAFADASIREIGVSEFIDNDVYSNFEVCPSIVEKCSYSSP